ncbi:MAG: adenylate/guanylate cyclase domain-containing protein [Pseudomonadota bacterium]
MAISHPALAPLATAWRTVIRPRIKQAIEAGTQGYRPEIVRRLKIMNVVAYLVVFFTSVYVIHHFFVDYQLWKPVIFINLFLIAAAASVPFLHRYSEIAGGLMIAGAELICMFWIVAYLGRSSGVHLQYIALAAAPFVILGLERLWLVLLVVVTAFALHLASWFMFPGDVDLVAVSSDNLDSIYVSAAVTTFVVVAGVVYYAFKLADDAQRETDALLRNILPVSVVDRLRRAPGEAISDSVESASVLFSDLKGFVPTSKGLGPQRTVALLNDLMKGFDAHAAAHGCEKIKTIGDAYMVAAGVPEQVDDHEARLARLALAMMAEADRVAADHGVALVMRIGIASGPLMAGVIGAKRLTYDVWGDTVNLAARLESTAPPGEVQVSATVQAALAQDGFAMQHRGKTEIKGMGPLDTWILRGEPSDAAAGAMQIADGRPAKAEAHG